MKTILKYFWIVEYNDGTALPQFDPDTGKENLFKTINQSKMIRFGIYPFSFEFSKKIDCGVPSLLSKIVINLNNTDKLFFRRRNYIERRGRIECRHIEYLLGTQDYVLHIDEFGNIEVKKE